MKNKVIRNRNKIDELMIKYKGTELDLSDVEYIELHVNRFYYLYYGKPECMGNVIEIGEK